MRRGYALALTAALVLLALISVAVAQSRRAAPTPQGSPLVRALNEGRYDEVAGLAERMEQQDPNVAALVARADIARGRYKEAEARLRPLVQRWPTSDAALQLGLLLKMVGRAGEATPLLERVASIAETSVEPNDLARGATALRALNRAYEANAAYRDAANAAPRDASINTAWGDLFLEKYKKDEALKSYQAVLRDDPRWSPALLGSARALADDDPPQSIAIAKKALEVNPSYVDAYVFLAQQASDASRRDEARTQLEKALEINPNSLDAHALLAGLAYVEDKQPEYESEVAKATAIAPSFGEVFRVAAELAAQNFRYDEAVVLIRRALTLDPSNPKIQSDLGVHLLRTGDEAGARTALETSFKADAFNAVTFNLLQMLDKVDGFVTVRDGEFIIKMDKAEAPVLQEYAVPLAHQAMDTLMKRYGFTPKGPILVEIFPKHDDFAVRNVGLPGMIGALGACFGRVVTMDSPHAQPGSFQWEATLWHELAHVITMQMSNYRIPRWLTEGISVYEEKQARPEWARGQDLEFASLMNRGDIMKVRDLNSAFTDPRKISLAYFEASLLVDHIVTTYGDDGLHRLLRAYGEGKDSEAAFKSALNSDYDQMQSGFDQTLEKNFGKLRAALEYPGDKDEKVDLSKMPLEQLKTLAEKNPGSYPVNVVYGHALVKSGQFDAAEPVFERAAELVPIATGDDSPNAQLAELALRKKDNARAMEKLRALMTWDFDNVEVARKLAVLMRDSGVTDPARVAPVYQRIVAIDPFDAEAHATLGRLSMQANQPEIAVREFKAVVALGPVDQAAAYTDLAESYLKSGKRSDARKQTLAALEIAPSYERAQNLLLELAGSRP